MYRHAHTCICLDQYLSIESMPAEKSTDWPSIMKWYPMKYYAESQIFLPTDNTFDTLEKFVYSYYANKAKLNTFRNEFELWNMNLFVRTIETLLLIRIWI